MSNEHIPIMPFPKRPRKSPVKVNILVELENTINQKGFMKQEGFGRDGALHTVTIIIDTRVEGAGGPRSIFTFLLFLIEENDSYQELFSEWQNIVPSQSY